LTLARCQFLVVALFGVPAFAQTGAKAPEVFVYYARPGDAAYSWKSVVLDPSLTLTLDSAGQAHLGAAIPPQPRALVEKVAVSAVTYTPAAVNPGDPPTGVFSYSLAHAPAPGTMLFVMFASSVNWGYLVAATPAVTASGQPNVIEITSAPIAHPLTADDTITIAYWTLEP
jgi:hypothetical protein